MEIRKKRASAKIQATTEFLAVDLEIVSQRKLDDLIKVFGSESAVNQNERVGRRHVLLLSIGGFPSARANPERFVNQLLRRVAKRVERLAGDTKTLWTGARTKTIDIGFQAGEKPLTSEIRLDRKTVEAIARIGACIKITIYGARQGQLSG